MNTVIEHLTLMPLQKVAHLLGITETQAKQAETSALQKIQVKFGCSKAQAVKIVRKVADKAIQEN